MWIYWLGLIVHVMLILSASDIFFKKYLGSTEYKCIERNATSNRVVFIVAEGLDDNHLKDRMNGMETGFRDGFWGTSQGSNINSEFSGITSLVSGYSVDLVTTFFRRHVINIEDIDNVMNRSSEVFYMGSRRTYESIYKDNYEKWWTFFNPNLENSLLSNSSSYVWSETVAVQMSNLLTNAYTNQTLNNKLRRDKTIFFIHLDSISKASQLYGYKSNAVNAAVDSLFASIESITDSVENFFNYNGTTFILCSNFMLKGKRGQSGLLSSEDNQYPFMAWGAGIRNYSSPVFISQIEVSAMISTLLGLNYPANSRGNIPFHLLDMNREDMIASKICKAMQLYSLAVEAQSRLPYNSSFTLTPIEEMYEKMLSSYNDTNFISNESSSNVISQSIDKIKEQEYFFKSIVWHCSILLSVSWILLIFSEILPYRVSLDNKSLISFSELKIRMTTRINSLNNRMASALRGTFSLKPNRGNKIVDDSSGKGFNSTITRDEEAESSRNMEMMRSDELQNEQNKRRSDLIRWKWLRGLTDLMFFLTVSVIFFIIFFLEWDPIYFLYTSTPVLIVWLFSYSIIDWIIFARQYFFNIWKRILLYSFMFLYSSSLIIKGLNTGLGQAFGLILILLPFNYINLTSWSILSIWFSTGCFIYFFGESELWYSTTPATWVLIPSVALLILWNVYAAFRLNPKGIDFIVTAVLLWQSGMTLGCMIFTDTIHSAGKETPYALKVTCWVLVFSYFLPALHGKNNSSSVMTICMAISVPFLLLSTAYEPLFYLFMTNFMITWMLLEGYTDDGRESRELDYHDAKRSLLFVYFIFYAYKLLGNDSGFMNADFHAIRCFTETLYEPTSMLLLFIKPVLIYSMMVAIFLVICSSTGVKENKEMHMVLLLFQLINIKLFFMIKLDEDGSLTDSSVSSALSYFMVNAFAIILILLVISSKLIFRLPMSTNR